MIPRFTVGTYALVHIPSGRRYIGSSKRCINNRFSHHLVKMKKGLHNEKIQALWSGDVKEWEVIILSSNPDDEQLFLQQTSDPLNVAPNADNSGRHLSEDLKKRLSESRARYLETEGAKESLSERAKKQHSEKNFGAHTWTEGPKYNPKSGIAGGDALKAHIAKQSSEEMRRRSLLRKNIKRPE